MTFSKNKGFSLTELLISEHQSAGKELVRLVIGNHGIPDDSPIISMGLTKTVMGICTHMPGGVNSRLSRRALLSLEKDLADRYASREAYLQQVQEAAEALVQDQLLLAEDVAVCLTIAGERYDAGMASLRD